MEDYLNNLKKNHDNDEKFFELVNNNDVKLGNCLVQLSAINGISMTENKKALNNYTGQLLKQGIGSLREKYLKNVEETEKEKLPVKKEKIFTKKIEPIVGGTPLRELKDMEKLKAKNLQLREKIKKSNDKNDKLIEEIIVLKETIEKNDKEIENMKDSIKKMSNEKYIEPIKGKTDDFKFKIYPDKIHVRKISGQEIEIERIMPKIIVGNPFHGMYYYHDLNGKHKIYDEKNREIFFVKKV